MILRYTKVEVVDPASRLILKRTALGDRELLNRKQAITNQLYSYERQRLEEGKGVFPDAAYQTLHLFNDKKGGWDYGEIERARSHADKYGRIFLPLEQRNEKQWKALTWDDAETSFITLANKGLQFVSYPIPLNASLEDWEERKALASGKILPSQEIVPILSSRHNEDTFQHIVSTEIRKANLIGLHVYGLVNPIEVLNLSRLRSITMGLNANENCALFIGFNSFRRLPKHDSVSSAFAYSTFGIDIFSPWQMSEGQMKAMLKDTEKLKEQMTWLYDPTQGGYSTNPDQESWHEIGLIDLLLNKVPVAEMLNKYQTLIWASTLLEQKDLDLLNGKLLSKDDVATYVASEKSRWAVFWSKYGASAIG